MGPNTENASRTRSCCSSTASRRANAQMRPMLNLLDVSSARLGEPAACASAACAGSLARGSAACEAAAAGAAPEVAVLPPASSRYPMNAASRFFALRSATNCAGGPCASTLPACIIDMRSQRSASFMKCVERKIVTPFTRDKRMSNSQNPSRATGSTPDVGSSRMSISGSCMTATASERPLPNSKRQAFCQRVGDRLQAEAVQ